MLCYAGSDAGREKRGLLAEGGAVILLVLSCRRSAGKGGIPESRRCAAKAVVYFLVG